MNYKIIWTPRAEKNFNNILAYLEEEWDDNVILDFFDKVDNVLKVISNHPEIFPEINENEKIRKCVITKQISLYYKIKDYQIDFITFWDNRQNPDKLNMY